MILNMLSHFYKVKARQEAGERRRTKRGRGYLALLPAEKRQRVGSTEQADQLARALWERRLAGFFWRDEAQQWWIRVDPTLEPDVVALVALHLKP